VSSRASLDRQIRPSQAASSESGMNESNGGLTTGRVETSRFRVSVISGASASSSRTSGANERTRAAGLPQPLDDLGARALLDIGRDEASALRREQLGGRPPDARRRAGDQRDLPLEPVVPSRHQRRPSASIGTRSTDESRKTRPANARSSAPESARQLTGSAGRIRIKHLR
jgi:hypothetical protein